MNNIASSCPCAYIDYTQIHFSKSVCTHNCTKKKLNNFTVIDHNWKLKSTDIVIYQDGELFCGAKSEIYSGTYCDKKCAIKIIKQDENGCTEINSMIDIGVHKNIVDFYGYCAHTEYYYIVMEKSNTNLDMWLNFIYYDICKMSETEIKNREKIIINIMLQIAEGIEYIHKTGAHLDIKTENILVFGYNKDIVVKICDFEFATKDEFSLKRNGTPLYVANEIFSTEEPYDTKKADIYSFGVLSFKLLHSDYPYKEDNNNINKLFFKIMNTEYNINENISKKMKSLLKSMMEKNPQQRPSIDTVIEKLK
jgi:serine/threonine protein kinase